jgi:7,8-dihydropterin-6-yl-methyl-4-(beta-D-ribofuranosyl)aminobenzene 5'-phosphate synthase
MRVFLYTGRKNWRVFPGLLLIVILSGCGESLSMSGNPLSKAEPTPAVSLSRPRPTITASSTAQASAVAASDPAEPGREETITITIVYDNYPSKPGLGTAWGFSALVEYNDRLLLFDTGGSGSLLLSNLAALGYLPGEIDIVVLSHEHDDHTGGLQALLSAGADPDIYIPPSFSNSFKNHYKNQARLIESHPGLQIAERIYTIGEMQGPPPEQALVIDTTHGLVVITGCAHPGVDKMVLEAKRQYKEDIYLVLGGFHLASASDSRVSLIIKEFQRLGVRYAAPCHCTGDHAIGMIRNAFGEDFLPVGVGAVIEIEGQ